MRITNFTKLKIDATNLMEVTFSSFNGDCPLVTPKVARNIPWWNQKLAKNIEQLKKYSDSLMSAERGVDRFMEEAL